MNGFSALKFQKNMSKKNVEEPCTEATHETSQTDAADEATVPSFTPTNTTNWGDLESSDEEEDNNAENDDGFGPEYSCNVTGESFDLVNKIEQDKIDQEREMVEQMEASSSSDDDSDDEEDVINNQLVLAPVVVKQQQKKALSKKEKRDLELDELNNALQEMGMDVPAAKSPSNGAANASTSLTKKKRKGKKKPQDVDATVNNQEVSVVVTEEVSGTKSLVDIKKIMASKKKKKKSKSSEAAKLAKKEIESKKKPKRKAGGFPEADTY